MVIQIINEILCPLTAFALGLLACREMKSFHRYLFFALLFWIILYVMSYNITITQKHQGTSPDNQWLFNLNTLVECSLLTFAASLYLGKRFNVLVVVLYVFFFVSFLVGLLFVSFMKFNNYLYVAEALLMVVLYLIILYKTYNEPSIPRIMKNPDFWISAGLLVYFTCSIPYFSLFSYLNEKHPYLSGKLFSLITDVLANVRYLCLAIAFWLIRWNSSKTNKPVSI